MKKQMLLYSFIMLSTLLVLPAVATEQITGARVSIEKVLAASLISKKSKQSLSPEDEKRKNFYLDLKKFAQSKKKFEDSKAVKQWLGLFDRFTNLPTKRLRGYINFSEADFFSEKSEKMELDLNLISMEMVIATIPGPGSWETLEEEVVKRKGETVKDKKYNAILRIVVALLQGKLEKTDQDVLALKNILETQSKDMMNGYNPYEQTIKELKRAIKKTIGFESPDAVVADYRAAISVLAKGKNDVRGMTQLKVPDLYMLTTENEAESILRETVKLPSVMLSVPAGGRTLKKLKEIVIAEIDTLKSPQWQLISSNEDGPLYEVMKIKFLVKSNVVENSDVVNVFSSTRNMGYNSTHERGQLRVVAYYISDLVDKGREEEATKLVRSVKLPSSIGSYPVSLKSSGVKHEEFAEKQFDFLHKMLTEKPELNWWHAYKFYASLVNKSDLVLKKVNDSYGAKENEFPTQLKFQKIKVKMLLAAGKVDEAVACIQTLSKTEMNDLSEREAKQYREGLQWVMRMTIELGLLLDKPDLVQEGLSMLDNILKKYDDGDQYNSPKYMLNSVASDLLEKGYYTEVEALVTKTMSQTLKKQNVLMMENPGIALHSGPVTDLSQELTILVKMYDKLGLYKDVDFLFKEAAWWGMPVLISGNSHDLIVPAARALYAEGKKEAAVQLLKKHIIHFPENDDAYEQLLTFQPDDLEPWLDALYLQDKFEERPLIWKAVWLMQQNRLEQAEETIRKALKVDPTDGETEAGYRVRAYSVLAEILEKRGNKKDAEFFKSVVRSVRTAEKGDEFTEAGLISMSLTLYEQAEMDFVDAYCVQWRLAERLYAMGRVEEAEKHYAIAFERMPEQFGRVASFCFGCNGVFEKERSQSVAERVLERLLKTNPDKPQVHFLTGQLRQAQGDSAKAYLHYKKAVELDPEYLDAWEKLYQMKNDLFLSRKEIIAMALTSLKLDPMQRHFGANTEYISDIKGVWNIMEENLSLSIDYEDTNYELSASKKIIDDSISKNSQYRQQYQAMYDYSRANPHKPWKAVLGHRVMQQLFNLLRM